MKYCEQLKIILWKNWMLHRRSPVVTVFLVALPIYFAIQVLLVRAISEREDVTTPTLYEMKKVDYDPTFFSKKNATVVYTPYTKATKKVMAYVKELHEQLVSASTSKNKYKVLFIPYKSEYEALRSTNLHPTAVQHVIVFDNAVQRPPILPKHARFTIRPYTGMDTWYTDHVYQSDPKLDPREEDSAPYYASRGFLYMQRLVGEGIIRLRLEELSGNPGSVAIGAYSQRMSYPSHTRDDMVAVIEIHLPFSISAAFLFVVIIMVRRLAYERELNFKEYMLMMGITPSVHWLAWFLTFLIYVVPTFAIYELLLASDLTPGGPVLDNSNMFLFSFFLLSFAMAVITFCFMISAMGFGVTVSAILAVFFYWVSYAPYFYIESHYVSLTMLQKISIGLSFNSVMAMGTKLIRLHEASGEGAQFTHFYKTATTYDNLSLLHCMLLLLFDASLHLCLAVYFISLRPGPFGTPKSFYFFLTPSYWRGLIKEEPFKRESSRSSVRMSVLGRKSSSTTRIGIQMKHLRKEYDDMVAVADVNLSVYQGQVFVLLGHKGAGKTTITYLLTGQIQPTSGTAIINGFDINKDMEEVHSSIGSCLKLNFLFWSLTTKDHLLLMAKLRQVEKSEVDSQISSIVAQLNLEESLKVKTYLLNGSQQKKLFVGMSLIGNPKTIILDEPTSGMDVAAKLHTWNVLQNYREGRTILMTSGDLEEAQTLGDRIGIMAHGVIQCSGSLQHIKDMYESCYQLTVGKRPNCRVGHLTETIEAAVPGAVLKEDRLTDVVYSLPDTETANFASLLTELDNTKDKKGLKGFSITSITFDDIFYKLAEAPPENVRLLPRTSIVSTIHRLSRGSKLSPEAVIHHKGIPLLRSQVQGLLVKKVILARRNPWMTLVQLLLPVLFTSLALPFDDEHVIFFENNEMVLDLQPFGNTSIPYTSGTNPLPKDVVFADVYAKQFGNNQTLEKIVSNKSLTFDDYTVMRGEEMGVEKYNRKMIIGFEGKAAEKNEKIAGIARYNGQPYHAQAIAFNMLMNSFLKFYISESFSLQSSIHPLPQDPEKAAIAGYRRVTLAGLNLAFGVIFGLGFLSAFFIYFPIRERQVGSRHLQMLNGVSASTYWMASFVWDLLCYLATCILLLCVIVVVWKEAYVGGARLFLVMFALFLFGLAIITFSYALHFAFKHPIGGVVGVVVVNLVTGVFTLMTVGLLSANWKLLREVSQYLDWLFTILFPTYNLGQSLVNINTNYLTLKLCKSLLENCESMPSPCCPEWCDSHDFCLRHQENYMAFLKPGIGAYQFFLALHVLLYSVIIMVIETRMFSMAGSPPRSEIAEVEDTTDENVNFSAQSQPGVVMNVIDVEDEDMDEKGNRVECCEDHFDSTDALSLVNLVKRYRKHTVVDHINVGVPVGQCFGFLGYSGAGKSTIMKILSGNITMTDGQVYFQGQELQDPTTDIAEIIGYCPQQDALLDEMTGRQTLSMYARLRGVPEAYNHHMVQDLLLRFLLKNSADEQVKYYSVVKKRKLSLAIALMGNPRLILVDEPTTGLDPVARSQIWDRLALARLNGSTLVLTSSSLEECLNLCDRYAIITNGKFQCLGSPDQLSQRLVYGYTIIVQMQLAEDGFTFSHGPLIKHVSETFPGVKVFDSDDVIVQFQMTDPKLSLLFEAMEESKQSLHVQSYSVAHTKLEHIFWAFVRAQTPTPVAETRWIGLCL